MPYIFYSNRTFSLIDFTPKNGVFCQIFSSNYSPKPIQIQFQSTQEYSAHMDHTGKLYVATMPDTSHLNYYTFENNRFIKNTLVSNNSSNYTLSSPMIYTLQDVPYITYLSNQAHSNTYNFVQENLLQPQLTTLLTSYTRPEHIKYFVTSDAIYIFYITFDEVYQLNALQITPTAVKPIIYLKSSQPIVDYSICLDEYTLHITYVAELHGKYQLLYFNTRDQTITSLATTQYPPQPVIFCYYHALWINAMIEHKLQMFISIDQGQNFSIPVTSSLQNNIHRCHFLTHNSSSLIAHELYAAIGSSLKLCTIAMADVEHFHSDTTVSPELELLLEGLVLASQSKIVAPSPIPPFTKEPSSSSSKHPHASNKAPASNTLNDATAAFMNELSGWDLPPRI